MPEAFPPEPPDRTSHLLGLLADDVRTEVPIRTRRVALVAELRWQVHDDRDRQAVVLARKCDERLPRLRLNVGRIDDRELAGGKALGRDEVEHLERIARRGLAVLVVAHESAAEV